MKAGRTGRKIRRAGLLAAALLLAGCSRSSEDSTGQQESAAWRGSVTEQEWETEAAWEDGEERNDSDIYWELAQDLLSDMLLEGETVEGGIANKGRELFSDEWYDNAEFGGRLTDDYLYVFECIWRDGVEFATDDMTFFDVEYPRRAGDSEGWFVFSVWVKETEHGVELGTDFPQRLFQQELYKCSKEHYEEQAYLIGLSPSEQWMMFCPLFDILGEPLVMVSTTEKEQLEPVFRDVCERMYERQIQIEGDLGQTVRFGAVFDDYKLAWRSRDEIEYEDFEPKERWQQYSTYMDEQRQVAGYQRWLTRYGDYYPPFRLDFHTGYDSEKQDIFEMMCTYRERYLDSLRDDEEDETEGETAQGSAEGSSQEPSGEREFWTVQKGDSLWRIARQQYGDGSQWRRIYERNRELIGEDANRIFPGQELELP